MAIAQSPPTASDAVPHFSVTVTAPRPPPLSASTVQLTAQELGAVPYRTSEDALRLVPGLIVVQHGSEGKARQYFLRGFDAMHGSDFEVTLEGIPVNEWSNIHAQGYLDLGLVIPEAIETVTVTKGPFLLEQGPFALAGSAAYRMGIPEQDRGLRSTVTVGSTERRRGVVSYSDRQGDGRDFVVLEAVRDGGYGQNRKIARTAANARLRLLDSARHGTLALVGAGHLSRFGLPGAMREEDVQRGTRDFFDAYDPRGLGASGRALLALDYKHRTSQQAIEVVSYGGRRRLGLTENFTGFLFDPLRGDRRRQFQSTWTAGTRASYRRRLIERMSLVAGAGVHVDRLHQAQVHLGDDYETINTEREIRGTQVATYALTGLQLRVLEAVQVSVGARLDAVHMGVRDELEIRTSSPATLATLSPRAVVQWDAWSSLRLFAAYGHGLRPPEARAVVGHVSSHTGLSDERIEDTAPAMTSSATWELGARWRPDTQFGLRLTGFTTSIARESVFDHVSGLNLDLNRTRRLGLELEADIRPWPWLSLGADASVVDARFVASQAPIPFAPWLIGGGRAVVMHPSGVSGGLRFLGLGPRPLPHGARGAPLVMLDTTLGYERGWWRVAVEIENVMNLMAREGEYHFASHWEPNSPPTRLPVVHYVAAPPRNIRISLTTVL